MPGELFQEDPLQDGKVQVSRLQVDEEEPRVKFGILWVGQSKCFSGTNHALLGIGPMLCVFLAILIVTVKLNPNVGWKE